MAFKQPRVPQMREGTNLSAIVREVVLFLKDFCLECWAESRRQSAEIEKIKEQMKEM